MTYQVGMRVEWNPRSSPKWVPARVVARQYSSDYPVVIALDGNEQHIAVVSSSSLRPVSPEGRVPDGDLIGTVRREVHDDGYSIWVLVSPDFADSYSVVRYWLCIESTAHGNCGARVTPPDADIDSFKVIGVVPGTEAAEHLVSVKEVDHGAVQR